MAVKWRIETAKTRPDPIIYIVSTQGGFTVRHRRYSLLAVTVILRTLLAAGSPHSSLAAQQCTVQEEQRWRTLAAQFSVGSLSVKVTVPSVLVRSTTVYLETSTTDSARFDEKLLLESGSEKVVIANGAALHLAPRHRSEERRVGKECRSRSLP